MPTSRKAITFSMPPELAEQVQQLLKEEGRTMSEFLREAIRLYMDEREWLRRERRQRPRPAGTTRNEQGGRTYEPEHRLHARGPLRQSLQ